MKPGESSSSIVRPLVIAASLIALAAVPAAAGNNGKGKGKGKPAKTIEKQIKKSGKGNSGEAGAAHTKNAVRGAITSFERTTILDYLHAHPGAFGTPRGLPPGIAKNYARGKPLPPGIAKRYLPGNLVSRLPPRPGHDWIVVGRDVTLVERATRLVVDVLRSVL